VDGAVHPGSNNQSPPASLEDLFISIAASSEDLHLEPSGHNALNNGTDLSGSFTDDIDGETRPTGANTWDIGADEYVPPLTSLYRSVGITASALASGSGSTQAIKIQRGISAIGNAGGTDSPGTPFGSTTSTFVLNQSNRYTNSGRTSMLDSSSDIDDLSGGLALTGTNTISFYRDAASEAVDYTFHWEAWEYIGAAGGDNEFVVLGRFHVTIAAGNRTGTDTVTAATNRDKCIPFITGILNSDPSNDADDATAVAWMSADNTVTVERGGVTDTTEVYGVVVEFTGSNWRVGHGRTADVPDDTGTINLFAESVGTSGGTPWSVNNWSNALIFHQFKADDDSINDLIPDNSATYFPGTNADEVDWYFHSNHTGVDNQHMVHVLENAGMTVTRYTDTGNAVGDNLIDITASGITDLTNTVCVGSANSSGTGASYSRGWKGIYLAGLEIRFLFECRLPKCHTMLSRRMNWLFPGQPPRLALHWPILSG
jgi:hypothetical protein